MLDSIELSARRMLVSGLAPMKCFSGRPSFRQAHCGGGEHASTPEGKALL